MGFEHIYGSKNEALLLELTRTTSSFKSCHFEDPKRDKERKKMEAIREELLRRVSSVRIERGDLTNEEVIDEITRNVQGRGTLHSPSPVQKQRYSEAREIMTERLESGFPEGN